MKLSQFTYWEGPMPRHIKLCLASMCDACKDCEFHLVTPDNVGAYVDICRLHRNYCKLNEPAHRADCIRALLLATHGGFYFDADTIGLRCPSKAFNRDGRLLYCVWDNPPWRVLNGYVYADKHVGAKWLDGVNDKLRHMPRDGMPWTALGEGVLTGLAESIGKDAVQVERSTFLPIDVDSDVQRFFSTDDPAKYVVDGTVCFGLNNSWMSHNKPKELEAIGRRHDLLIHKLFDMVKK